MGRYLYEITDNDQSIISMRFISPQKDRLKKKSSTSQVLTVSNGK
jgi:hypothetical protein